MCSLDFSGFCDVHHHLLAIGVIGLIPHPHLPPLNHCIFLRIHFLVLHLPLDSRVFHFLGNTWLEFTRNKIPKRSCRSQKKQNSKCALLAILPSFFDVDMVNTLLSIFLAKGKLSLACKLFEIFNDAGVSQVSYCYNSIMSSFVKKGYFIEAWAVVAEMGEIFYHTDIATYNMILQGLGKMGRVDLPSVVLDPS
ncbi:hypothetical protein LR48_Vigan2399s000100 [Vigna angularis]|nr:hypothetical protein LR48_Vigan2399s000100 [Vigna angularis]